MRVVTLILLAAVIASPAAAGPRRGLTFARVPVGDLDLSTEAGAAKMFKRLKDVAQAVCHETPSPLFPGSEGRAWRCRREALAAAVERLKAPRLSLAFTEWLSAEPGAHAPSPRVW